MVDRTSGSLPYLRLEFRCAWKTDFVYKPGNTLGFFLQSAHFHEHCFRYYFIIFYVITRQVAAILTLIIFTSTY